MIGIAMRMPALPFETTIWESIDATVHPGEHGVAYWRTRNFGDVRIRMVEYSPGYLADHWCEKGHVILCMDGELHTELKDGRMEILRPGMSYQTGDGMEPHRSYSPNGARLFIVD